MGHFLVVGELDCPSSEVLYDSLIGKPPYTVTTYRNNDACHGRRVRSRVHGGTNEQVEIVGERLINECASKRPQNSAHQLSFFF